MKKERSVFSLRDLYRIRVEMLLFSDKNIRRRETEKNMRASREMIETVKLCFVKLWFVKLCLYNVYIEKTSLFYF